MKSLFILVLILSLFFTITVSQTQQRPRRRTCRYRLLGSQCGTGFRCIDNVCIPCPRRARCQYRCGRSHHCVCGQCIRRSFGVYRLSDEQRRQFLGGR